MRLRKVLDQRFRDLKRKVNKKVLKVPDIKQKVLDATSNEPWGPHGTAMSEIAQATRNPNDFEMIMTILWKRLQDTGRNWRHVCRGLTLFDFLVAHGADRVIDDLKEHIYRIQALSDFEYVEPNGKDQGVNIRKKAQALVSLLNDKEKIREVRRKASANTEKYQGYSSTGGDFKRSSYSSTGGRDDDRRNGNARNGGDKYGGDRYDDEGRFASSYDKENDDWRSDREDDGKNSRFAGPPSDDTSHNVEEDDFNPRASSKRASSPAAAVAAPAAPKVDLLGQLDFFSTTAAAEAAAAATMDPFDLSSASKVQSSSSNPFASDAFASDFGVLTSAEPAKSTSKIEFPVAEPTIKSTSGTGFFAAEPSKIDLFAAKTTPTTSQTDFFAAGPFCPPLQFDNKAAASSDNLASLNTFDAFGSTLRQAPAPAASPFPDLGTAAPPAPQTKRSVWADIFRSPKGIECFYWRNNGCEDFCEETEPRMIPPGMVALEVQAEGIPPKVYEFEEDDTFCELLERFCDDNKLSFSECTPFVNRNPMDLEDRLEYAVNPGELGRVLVLTNGRRSLPCEFTVMFTCTVDEHGELRKHGSKFFSHMKGHFPRKEDAYKLALETLPSGWVYGYIGDGDRMYRLREGLSGRLPTFGLSTVCIYAWPKDEVPHDLLEE